MPGPSPTAELVRGRFAVRLTPPLGPGPVLRRRDMGALIDPPDSVDSARFAEVHVHGGELVATFGSGEVLRASLDALVSPPPPTAQLVLENARLMTCDGPADDPLGLVVDGVVVVGGGQLLWIGPRSELAGSGPDLAGAQRIDCAGQLVTPGLIDCHAHPIFSGDRAAEFAMRAAGDDYQSIARRGGGIAATVTPTRSASFDELVSTTRARLARAFAAGTTSCEAKSGYDLTTAGELRLLEVACAVDALGPIDVSPTLLGAHVVPSERRHERAAYVAEVAGAMVPAAAAGQLATAVDVYCDEGAFSLDETRAILEAARAAGLGVRAHVGQFADLGGAELLAELGGWSVDHLEAVSDAGILAVARAGVVAVMLPVACVQLRQEPPRVADLRAAGVALAVATDMNPGSSNCELLPIAMWLATTRYGMTVEESWIGVTRAAARAAGIDGVGRLCPGYRADLLWWDCEHPAAIPYECGRNLVAAALKGGKRFGSWA